MTLQEIHLQCDLLKGTQDFLNKKKNTVTGYVTMDRIIMLPGLERLCMEPSMSNELVISVILATTFSLSYLLFFFLHKNYSR